MEAQALPSFHLGIIGVNKPRKTKSSYNVQYLFPPSSLDQCGRKLTLFFVSGYWLSLKYLFPTSLNSV